MLPWVNKPAVGMSGHDRYVYRPVPFDSRTIRLLRVLPSTEDDLLCCEMTIETIEETFTALSYTWGPSTHDVEILVENKLFRIRRNLWNFLNLARCNYASRKFWIDAICIDQTNDIERTHQVRMMASIYECAQNTMIWLSESGSKEPRYPLPNISARIKVRSFDSELSQCLRELRVAHNNQWRFKYFHLSNGHHLGDTFVCVSAVLQQICEHPYWDRLWIIQEIKLSRRHKYVLCGSLLITWTILVEILDYLIGSKYTRPTSSLFRIRSTTSDEVLSTVLAHEQQRYRQQLGMEVSHLTQRVGQQQRHHHRPAAQSLSSSRLSFFARQRLWQSFNSRHVRELTCPRSGNSFNGYSYHGISERIPFFIGYEGFQCADRRDKLYGLGHLWGNDNAFPADYSIDVYDLYFRACRIYTGRVYQYVGEGHPFEQQIPASWVTDTAGILRHLELGVLDLVFGDPQGRTRIMMLQAGQAASEAQQITPLLNVLLGTFVGICPRCAEEFHFEGHPTSIDGSYCIVQCHDHYDTQPRYNAGYERQHLVVYFIHDDHPSSLRHFASSTTSSLTNNTLPKAARLGDMRSQLSLPVLADLSDLHEEFPPRPPEWLGARRPPDTPRTMWRGEMGVSVWSLPKVFNGLRCPSTSRRRTTYTSGMLDSLRLEDTARECLSAWLEREGFDKVTSEAGLQG